ncbi:MAG: hypothetical protein LYZ66_07020 [Nitrososphaerales archaeon]|nr:hypothetical protein [Nitrososphaerales archaeon]
MVKLQKHKAYTYETGDGKKIEHFKHLVTIPDEVVQELGWTDGQNLTLAVSKNRLMLQADSGD